MLFVKGEGIIVKHHLNMLGPLKEVQDKLDDQVTAKTANVRQVRKAPEPGPLHLLLSERAEHFITFIKALPP